MIKRFALALVALASGFALLFAPSAQATSHFGPKVTVDLRKLPKGDCWYEVDRHGVDTICAPTPLKATGDCALVAPADYALCTTVRTQRAYGWTDQYGDPQNWNASGKAQVHEITHGGLSKAEMHDALVNSHRDFRDFVTAVTFNVDGIARKCGSHHGQGEVSEVRGKDGHYYTWIMVACD
jgi:hypothetical protein